MESKSEKVELINLDKKDYGESQYHEHILEQYKLFVQSAEKVTDRRNNMNNFYLSLTTAIAGVVGYIKTADLENAIFLLVGLGLSAIIICRFWVVQLDNYRKLNTGKFKVIHEIEKSLPLKLFDFEWEKLGQGKDSELYRNTSNVEKSIPIIFGVLFTAAIIYEVVNFLI